MYSNRQYRATVDVVTGYILLHLQKTLVKEGIAVDADWLENVKEHGTTENVYLLGSNIEGEIEFQIYLQKC